MARFKFGRPVSLRWNGLLVEGPAETVFEIPDEYYEEFNEDIGGVEPTLVWLDADEGSTLRARVTALELASGSFAILDAKGDLISATADNVAARIGVGTNGQVLVANSATSTGLQWQENVSVSTTKVKEYVKNDSGVTINKGQAVYVSGANGTNVLVDLADYDTDETSSKTLGLMETTVSNNGFGYVITQGILTGFDTTAASAAGVPVWLGENGNLVYGTAPSEPAHTVYIGVVTHRNANNGEVFIKVQNGYELTELHDVEAASPADNDIIQYNSTSGTWKNETLSNAGIATSSHNHSGVYDPAGTAASAVSTHEAASDPHPTYLTSTEGNAAYAATGHAHSGVYDPAGTAASAISTHESAADPHPTYLTSTEGNAAYATTGHTHGALMPTGSIAMWPTETAPSGWLFLNGATISQATYPELAAVFGVVSGTFTLPDMRDRFAAGASTVAALSNNAGTFAPNTANSIAHDHTTNIAHGHADTIAVSTHGDHTHSVNPAATTSGTASITTTGETFLYSGQSGTFRGHTHSTDIAATTSAAESANLTHTVTGGVTSLGTTSVTSSSAGGTLTPKSTLLNFIIKT
jgi:hypothetical protein